MPHIGRRLKALMQAKHITTEQMAFHCGVTPGAVSNWFSTGHITRDNLVVCADVLRESLRYLMTGDEEVRALSEVEFEWSRRAVSAGTREAILTLLRASPMRAPVPPAPPAAAGPEPGPAGSADEAHYKRAIAPPEETPPAPGRRRRPH